MVDALASLLPLDFHQVASTVDIASCGQSAARLTRPGVGIISAQDHGFAGNVGCISHCNTKQAGKPVSLHKAAMHLRSLLNSDLVRRQSVAGYFLECCMRPLPGLVAFPADHSWHSRFVLGHPWISGKSSAGSCGASSRWAAYLQGVMYTHRSNWIAATTLLSPDGASLSASSQLLLIVPMFHANGWCLPYACTAAGAGLVLPGV